jgi:hypothetical protein
MLFVWGACLVGHVPSTTWPCRCSIYCFAELSSEAQVEAISLVLTIWLCKNLRVMHLAKHHFASLREIHQDPTMHEIMHWQKDIWCARKSAYWLKVWCYGLDAELLLLAGELWLAPSLPFSSWFTSWLLVLLLLVRDYSTLPSSSASRIQSMFYGFVFWCGGVVLENCGVLLMVRYWSNGCFLPWPCTSPPAAGSAGCCGAASSSLSQVTELLVSS